MVQGARWPLANLLQPWVAGQPLPLVRHWAHSCGSELSSRLGSVRVEVAESEKYNICFSAPHYKLVPIIITDQPSKHENCIFLFLLPFCLSSLYCVSELGVIRDYSLAVSACRMVFDDNFNFPFLEKLQGNGSPNIDISVKLQDQLHKLLLYLCIIIRL